MLTNFCVLGLIPAPLLVQTKNLQRNKNHIHMKVHLLCIFVLVKSPRKATRGVEREVHFIMF